MCCDLRMCGLTKITSSGPPPLSTIDKGRKTVGLINCEGLVPTRLGPMKAWLCQIGKAENL